MAGTATAQATARAVVNFVEDREGQKFSNWDASRWDMRLVPMETDLVNIRDMAHAPRLSDEGFTLADHPVSGDWKNPAWVDAVYVPSCVELVKRLTGAREVIQIFFPLIRSSALPGNGVAAAAHFLHLDIPREEYFGLIGPDAKKHGLSPDRRHAAIYNVWKAISPPPQNMPLALCTKQAIPEADHVIGINDEDEYRSHFVCSRPPATPAPMYYVPDMQLDESLVFIAADFDETRPLGCAHQAVVPLPETARNPRTSIEVRLLALY